VVLSQLLLNAGNAPHELRRIRRQDVSAYFIEGELPVAALVDQTSSHKLPHVMGNGALGHACLLAKLLARILALAADGLEQRHTPRVGQRLGHCLELAVGQGTVSASWRHSLTNIKLRGRSVKVCP
jgi:hypothetical protein